MKQPVNQRKKILSSLELLYAGKTKLLDIKKMEGYQDTRRLRIGDKRIIYKKLPTGDIEILGCGSRGDIYKSL